MVIVKIHNEKRHGFLLFINYYEDQIRGDEREIVQFGWGKREMNTNFSRKTSERRTTSENLDGYHKNKE
jgi:hypothetical protein